MNLKHVVIAETIGAVTGSILSHIVFPHTTGVTPWLYSGLFGIAGGGFCVAILITVQRRWEE